MIRCTELEPGVAARVARLELDSHLSRQMAALGIVPGAPIVVLQRWPSWLVRCEETEIALEGSVAGRILVREPASVLSAASHGRTS